MPLSTHRIPVRWGDQDVLGHVNNAAYLRLVEEARVQWLYTLDGLWTEDEGPILASVSLSFRRPIVYPATVVAEQHVARVGRTSLTLRTVLTVEGDDGPAAEAEAVIVWVGAEGPTPLPDALRAALVA